MARNVTDREIAAAREQGAVTRARGLAATSVRYDAASRRILLELTNGALFGVPVGSLPSIAGASEADLRTVELLGESIVHIDSLDADYSVAGLVMNAVGRVAAARTLGKAGGSATSDAKAEAARRNGAKGGRPPGVATIQGSIATTRGKPVLHDRDGSVHLISSKSGKKKAAKRGHVRGK